MNKNWFSDYILHFEALFTLASFVCLFIGWRFFIRIFKKIGQKSRIEWDDMILRAINLPITLLIVILAAQHLIGVLAGDILFAYTSDTEKIFSDIRAVIILITVFWTLLRLVSGVELLYRRKKINIKDNRIDEGTIYSVFRVIRAIIFIVAILTAMNSVGVSVSGILTFGGVGGIIIGFAAKDTLSNFFSGMLIFWERPFVIGDWIRHPDSNIEGVVESIGWRMTQIRTFDQRPLYVPNSLFFNSVIENPQRMTNRRIYEYMGIRYDDINRLPQILTDIRQLLSAHDDIDQSKVQIVAFDRYGASSLDFFIYAMTKTTGWIKFHQAKEDILLKIANVVAQHGAEFAFPTRTLHHRHHNDEAPERPPVAALGGE